MGSEKENKRTAKEKSPRISDISPALEYMRASDIRKYIRTHKDKLQPGEKNILSFIALSKDKRPFLRASNRNVIRALKKMPIDQIASLMVIYPASMKWILTHHTGFATVNKLTKNIMEQLNSRPDLINLMAIANGREMAHAMKVAEKKQSISANKINYYEKFKKKFEFYIKNPIKSTKIPATVQESKPNQNAKAPEEAIKSLEEKQSDFSKIMDDLDALMKDNPFESSSELAYEIEKEISELDAQKLDHDLGKTLFLEEIEKINHVDLKKIITDLANLKFGLNAFDPFPHKEEIEKFVEQINQKLDSQGSLTHREYTQIAMRQENPAFASLFISQQNFPKIAPAKAVAPPTEASKKFPDIEEPAHKLQDSNFPDTKPGPRF